MFMARLEQASKESHRSAVPVVPKHKQTTTPLTPVPSSALLPVSPSIPVSVSRKAKSQVLHELNDYLFDLFDANMMDDFHLVSRFEDKAMEFFEKEVEKEINAREQREGQVSVQGYLHQHDYQGSINNSDAKGACVTSVDGRAAPVTMKECKEFSHEIYHLHQEFLSLFEGLINKFLTTNNYTSDEIYDELYRYAQEKKINDAKSSDGPHKDSYNKEFGMDYDEYESHPEKYSTNDALEVLDVLAFYTDFPLWSDMMMENAKYRLKFKRLASVQQGKSRGPSMFASDSK